METVDFKPAKQRVLILPDAVTERQTPSGIIIPETAENKKPGTGVVVRTGKGEKDIPMEYRVGQRVMYSQYSGLDIELNLYRDGNYIYKVMNQMDIMGTIENTKS